MQPLETIRQHPLTPDPDDPYAGVEDGEWDEITQYVRALALTLWWTFVPHKYNSEIPKIVTTTLMFTWSAITIGKAFGFAEAGQFYPYITVLVFAIVCTIWGFEMGALKAFTNRNVEVAIENGYVPSEYDDSPSEHGDVPSSNGDERDEEKPTETR